MLFHKYGKIRCVISHVYNIEYDIINYIIREVKLVHFFFTSSDVINNYIAALLN